ncbi:MAG: (Fe-S)-binding protein [Myxococcaceae bacterium]
MSLSEHRQAFAYCAFCPKVCRFACPVSEATQSEGTSTWGKMTEAYLTSEGKRPLEASGAKALYACTGCLRCRSFCGHQNEVGYALFTARSQAVEKELAPKGALSTLKTLADHGNPFGVDLRAEVAAYRAEKPVRYPLFPGCSSLVKCKGLVEDALVVADALAAPVAVSRASHRCCGYPLYAAGDIDAFRAHAESTAQAMAEYPELVVLDPGCAYTFKVVYPRFDVRLATRVHTLYEVLAGHVAQAPQREKLNEPVAYQDACHLGRGLGQFDEPRALLTAAVEGWREAQASRAEGGCSGGGGLLPRTMGETSVEVARREARQVAPNGELIVTACPTSRRMFERAGRRSEDLLSLLRRWLKA